MKLKNIALLIILTLMACKKEVPDKKLAENPEQIVIISKYAFKAYKHYILSQDSLGLTNVKQSGPYTPVKSSSFTYFDSQNNINEWEPKPNVIDTIIIPYYRESLELSTRNVFTSLPNNYLIKNGDTVIFTYKNKLPIAEITNRKVNDIELNYNNYRLKTLFKNKYTSHFKIYNGIILEDGKDNRLSIKESIIKYYEESLKEKDIELQLLDSLHQENIISDTNYNYRVSSLNGLMEKPKNIKIVKNWLNQQKSLDNKELLEIEYGHDLSETDSLMTFSFFRDYLNTTTQYNLDFIRENRVGSGAAYIDSRIRFDSIIKDKRFNQNAKNFLLFSTYEGINRDFRVKDKVNYFKKLQEHTSSINQLNKLEKDLKLNFSKTDKLILTDTKKDTLTYLKILENNRGKWLYIDFWASWCAPCRATMPASNKLKKEFKNENIEFIYLSLNDEKEKWIQAIESDSISDSQNYFIENGNTSTIIEDLSINTIPHYLIYNPKEELVHGYANRPGRGAKEQLKKLMKLD